MTNADAEDTYDPIEVLPTILHSTFDLKYSAIGHLFLPSFYLVVVWVASPHLQYYIVLSRVYYMFALLLTA
jgi:hypothetical protein